MATIQEQKAADKRREKALFDSAYKKVGEAYKYAILPIEGSKNYAPRGQQKDYETLYNPYLLANAVILMAQEDHKKHEASYDDETLWIEIGKHVICEVTIHSTLYGKHKGSKRVDQSDNNLSKAFEEAQTGAMARALNFAGGYGLFVGEEFASEDQTSDDSFGEKPKDERPLASPEIIESISKSLWGAGIAQDDVKPFMTILMGRMPNGKLYEDQAQTWLDSLHGAAVIPLKIFDQYLRFLCKKHKKEYEIVKDFIDSAYDGIEFSDLEAHQQQELIAFLKEPERNGGN